MPDEERPVGTPIAMYLAMGVVTIGVIVAFTWFIRGGFKDLAKEDVEWGLIVFTFVILLIAIVLIVLLSTIFGKQRGGAPTSGSLAGTIVEKLSQIPAMHVAATVIGLVTVGLIGWLIVTDSDFSSTPEKARGLITFSVAIVTVGIALILVLYIIFGVPNDTSGTDFSNRFTFGKDVLMVFVGILGTIMGFYYGSDKISPKDVKDIATTVQSASGSATGDLEKKAYDLVLKQDFDAASKAFDDLYNATPASPNINNIIEIKKLLESKKKEFTDAGKDPEKIKKVWTDIQCKISDSRLTAGMTKDVIEAFDRACKALKEPTPSPPITPTP